MQTRALRKRYRLAVVMVVWLCLLTHNSLRRWRTLRGSEFQRGKICSPDIFVNKACSDTLDRSVHAKAAGAWGTFEVLDDVSDLTDAKFLSEVGKKTKVLTRISTVAGEKGSSDTVRDVRGWSLKFFTEDGNQDFVFNDLPVFFIRDPIKFPSMNRSHKRHPRTFVPDNNMFWDYHVNNPEGIHALMHLIGQRGIPASLRHINGFGVHTYTLNKEVSMHNMQKQCTSLIGAGRKLRLRQMASSPRGWHQDPQQ